MKKKIVPILAAVILIIIVAGIGIVSSLVEKYTPTDERVDVSYYLGLEKDDDLAIILQGEVIEDKGKIIDGVAYVRYATVKKYLNDRFYWDAKENVMLYTTPTDLISISVGSNEYYVSKDKNSESYPILKVDGDEAYLAVEFIQKYTDMDYEVFEEPNRLLLTKEWGDIQTTTVKKADCIRELDGIKSLIVADVEKSDKLTVLKKLADWSKVMTADGLIGYISNTKITAEKTEEVIKKSEYEEPVYTNIQKDYTINLAWHQVTSQEANNEVLNMIADTKGITTLSPTWFSISDNDGNISSLASNDYVTYAHQSNIEVWALVDNFNEAINTKAVLSSTTSRENLINQLISAAINYNLDGINIDFEEMDEGTGEAFIQFIRELSIKCRKNSIVLSIDNPVPSFTAFHNRKEQGIVADYVIIMGYDEHFSGDDKAGSVASLPFVIAGIEDTLAEVPKEKVINAVPFYTRLWKETTAENGSIALTSEALSMDYAASLLEQYGAEKNWSEETSQYYSEFVLEDGSYKIWLEEETSIDAKAKLIKTYDLAGIACWKLGLESNNIWDVILKYVN